MWARADGATQYRLTIAISGQSTTARTVTEHIPATPQANPPTSHTRTGLVGARYAITAAATRDGTAWSPESPSAFSSCTPVVPPAPTGVTASCTNGVLSVTWEPAGAGLAKATAYKPRIFTGANTAPDTRWTADAPSSATSAALPAQGEPALPQTGVFQVKVKASNTAGDSGWSDAAEAGCARNPVSELRAVCRDSAKLAITWKVAEWYRQSAASRQFAVEIDGAHVRDEAASGQPEQAYHWDGAEVNKQHKVRVGARSFGAHTPAEYPWTARVTADKCPRFVPQNATASCNSHGVVKVSWVAVEGAAKYKLDNLAYEGPGGADGDRRYAVAQRNEGETYTFRAAAHTAGDWGGWSNTATITCDPLDPSAPTRADGWKSPHGERVDTPSAPGAINLDPMICPPFFGPGLREWWCC